MPGARKIRRRRPPSCELSFTAKGRRKKRLALGIWPVNIFGAPEECLMSIANNIAEVRERIAAAANRAGRRPEEVALMAVSKTFPAQAIREAYDSGQRLFGE